MEYMGKDKEYLMIMIGSQIHINIIPKIGCNEN